MRVTNPPSNPELLDALADHFTKSRFDLKDLVRTICTTKVYQLSSTPNASNKDDQQKRHLTVVFDGDVVASIEGASDAPAADAESTGGTKVTEAPGKKKKKGIFKRMMEKMKGTEDSPEEN